VASFTVNKDLNLRLGPFDIILPAGQVGYVPDDLYQEFEERVEGTPGVVATLIATDRGTASGMVVHDLAGAYHSGTLGDEHISSVFASAINGVIDLVHIATGTTSDTVSVGDHAHAGGGEVTIAEIDGSPASVISRMEFPNGSLAVSGATATVKAVTPEGGGLETYFDIGDSGASATVNLANGNVQAITLNSATVDLALTGATSGKACSVVIRATQDSVGGRTFAWPASVTSWAGGIAPVLSTAPGAVDTIVLDSADGGTEWTGSFRFPGIIVQDEGTSLAGYATTLNFVGAGVTATATGGTATITISAATSSAGGGAPTDAKYIVASADSTLSAEIARPELDDFSLTGATNIDFTSPTSDNAALTFISDQAGVAKIVQCTDTATRRHAYVASAIGTGDFDLRMRVPAFGITVPHSSASNPLFALFAADSSLTASTRLSLQVQTLTAATGGLHAHALGVVNVSGSGNGISGAGIRVPIIMRITRTGTAVTFYVSIDEGRIWQKCGSATSSLNVGRIGLLMTGGSVGAQTAVAIVHWLRSF
jgi:hypothetical protein